MTFSGCKLDELVETTVVDADESSEDVSDDTSEDGNDVDATGVVGDQELVGVGDDEEGVGEGVVDDDVC